VLIVSSVQTGSRRYATGLIVGRFDPPHLGHSYLIAEAARRCARLAVFVNSGPVDAVPGRLRARWLTELHPEVTVVEVVHELPTDFGDEELWQRWIELFRVNWPFERGPDVVCSSDRYVAELARRLGAEPIVIDAQRATVPVSATMIREDPAAHLDRLAPPVRAWVEAEWL
jgi:HTH-type transcriptional regulator, transcriptional repressor of NAD biosynthesis genes